MTSNPFLWQRHHEIGPDPAGFAVIGVGRFGRAVIEELVAASADVLAIDLDQRAIDDLRLIAPAIEARVVDCTDEEALRAAGVFDMGTVVVAMREPIEASVTATLIAKDAQGTQVKRVIARATSELHQKMLQRVGADRVVFPSKMQGQRLGLELVRPNLLERLRLDDRNAAGAQPAQDLPGERAGRRPQQRSHRQPTGLAAAGRRRAAGGDGLQ